MRNLTNKERAQEWAANYAARSDKFVACMFLGIANFDKREAPTLEDARTHANEMLEEYADSNFGRGVIIYAVTPDFLSVYVEHVFRRRS